ncbi:protein kinase family protein [Oceanobacillus iheyensis]|uniref:Hypothetical conserved protein n=1 Tax=Oceanobacillus iheyensis (strain DSM 14371 / CIP 107618 / JCM 11309 / KCTC 3954 / HTE831) TaxID=221109 RepID=Q8ERL7_OCEIH|nr:protein kinase family protein [Oceanobacillus iheyensis]BAC13241.1 hypothetical conserved protein [Oceanobacillus iheyensis HTE831]
MKSSRYNFYVSTVSFINKNRQVKVLQHHPDLQIYGTGRSAVVFKVNGEHKVIKIFYPPFEETAIQEKNNYEKLEGSNYYPTIYESGPNYLVMDLIEGKTFFECLAEGILLESDYVHQVEEGLQYAREVGLNPSDIHLHNLIVTKEGSIKIIDVARFSQEKQCTQWQDLKNGYEKYYHRTYFPTKIPKWIMNSVSKLYRLLNN